MCKTSYRILHWGGVIDARRTVVACHKGGTKVILDPLRMLLIPTKPSMCLDDTH